MKQTVGPNMELFFQEEHVVIPHWAFDMPFFSPSHILRSLRRVIGRAAGASAVVSGQMSYNLVHCMTVWYIIPHM
jgi:hypothetical protein